MHVGNPSAAHQICFYFNFQVQQQLQTIHEPITLLCAKVQAGQLAEIEFPSLGDASKTECCAYDHKQLVMPNIQAPTARHMQGLIASMNDASAAADTADREHAAHAAPEQAHQLYEWIGGMACSLQGTGHHAAVHF